MEKVSLLTGATGIGTIQLADAIPDQNVKTITQVVTALLSVLPAIISLFKKKKTTK